MIIKIQFFPDAEDEMDAGAEQPLRTFHCKTLADAVMALGLIERHDKLTETEV